MTVDELRQVIVQPARRAGCVVEGSLLATLVAHAHGRVGALPLLSHALLETWRRRSGNTLTLAGFERAGGIDGALAKTAEAVFASLTEEQQSAARQLFLRLVALGDGAPDTKRRVAKEEFDDDNAAILTAFGDARLVVLSEHGVEITHEALIGAWPRLRSWLADDREGQRIHRKLTEATATWQEHDRDPGALLRGTRLVEVTAWVRGHRSAANRAETAFLDASVLADDRERAAVRRRAHVVRGLVALLTLLLVATIVTGIQAVRAQQSATQQGNVAIALNAIREAERLVGTNPELAAQISLAAYRLHPSQPTASSLVAHTAAATAVPLPTGGANFSLTPDGRLIAAAVPDVDNTVVFEIGSRAITPLGTVTGGKFPPRFSPDGERLLTVDNDAVSRLWGVTNPADPTTPSEIPASSTGGAFSPDTDVLVTTDATRPSTDPTRGGAGTRAEGPTTRIWSIADIDRPRQLATLPNTTAEVAAFADRGTAMATITDNGPAAPKRLAIWDLTDPAAPTIATYIDTPSDAQPESAAFARGGRILYVGDSAGNITAWNVETPGEPEELSSVGGNGKPIDELVASPDGRALASSDTEGRLTIWDISTSESPRSSIQVTNPQGGLDGMSFAADSDTVLAVVLATAPDKPSLVQWRMNPTRSARTLCQGSPARITEKEWNKYLAGAPYQPPCT
jgi:WD40 repeat protein